MTLEQTFQKEWRQLTASVTKPFKVVVGVSGGVDSMVLLSLLAKEMGAENLVLAHFDHAVRKTSAQDASWVTRAAQKLGISKIVVGRRQMSGTSEASLREERLGFLKETQRKTKACFIVLGHHAQDQLETLLMRLLRGTGVYGLSGIAKRNGALLRPLLECSKNDLLLYAQSHGIQFREDETNLQERYFRNAIRNQVIPAFLQLSSQYGGERLFYQRLSSLVKEFQVLKQQINQASVRWIKREIQRSPFWLKFERKGWLSLDAHLQEGIANQLWLELTGERLEKKEVKQFIDSIRAQKKTVLSGSIHVTTSCGVVYVQPPEAREAVAKFREEKAFVRLCDKQCQYKKLTQQLSRRSWELRFLEAGDRYRGKKMKERCIRQRIPQPERALLPVIAQHGSSEVLWYFPLKGPYRQYFSLPWSIFHNISL